MNRKMQNVPSSKFSKVLSDINKY